MKSTSSAFDSMEKRILSTRLSISFMLNQNCSFGNFAQTAALSVATKVKLVRVFRNPCSELDGPLYERVAAGETNKPCHLSENIFVAFSQPEIQARYVFKRHPLQQPDYFLIKVWKLDKQTKMEVRVATN